MSKVKRETAGFVVVEACEDYEQILGLEVGSSLPDEGVLEWPSKTGVLMAIFLSRKDARAAINRTHHYAQAFGDDQLPEKRYCRVERIETVRIASEPTP